MPKTYCSTCGKDQEKRRVIYRGFVYNQCTFCKADDAEPLAQIIVVDTKGMWHNAHLN